MSVELGSQLSSLYDSISGTCAWGRDFVSSGIGKLSEKINPEVCSAIGGISAIVSAAQFAGGNPVGGICGLWAGVSSMGLGLLGGASVQDTQNQIQAGAAGFGGVLAVRGFQELCSANSKSKFFKATGKLVSGLGTAYGAMRMGPQLTSYVSLLGTTGLTSALFVKEGVDRIRRGQYWSGAGYTALGAAGILGSAYAASQLYAGSQMMVPTDTGSQLKVPADTGSQMIVPANIGSLVKVPTDTGSQTMVPTDPKRYWLIDSPGSKSGMFSTLITVLGMLSRYEREPGKYSGFELNFGESGTYYDPARGSNWWQYYFEPVQIGQRPDHVLGNSKSERWHYANCAESNYNGTGMQIPREVAFGHIQKHFRLRKDVAQKIENFVAQNFQGKKVISVHYRGTDKVQSDFAESTRISYEEMEEQIRKQIAQSFLSDFKIFVATDEQAFVKYIQEKFPGKVVTTSIARSTDGKPLHMKQSDPAGRGEEALIDCMLLARGDVLVRTSSNLSLFSTFVNPQMPVVEVSKRIETKHSKNMFKTLKDSGLIEC